MAALCPSVSTADMTKDGYFYKQTIRAGDLYHVYLQSFKNWIWVSSLIPLPT